MLFFKKKMDADRKQVMREERPLGQMFNLHGGYRFLS